MSAALTLGVSAYAELPTGGDGLAAPRGVTGVAGVIQDTNGNGLPNIKIGDETESTFTDSRGRFLLNYVPAGKSVLRVDGRHSGNAQNIDFGVYELPVRAKVGQTQVLDYPIRLTPIDHAHEVILASPTTSNTVISSPLIPNFKVVLAPGVVIRDEYGAVITKVTLTQLPSGKSPFPRPGQASGSIAFTIQPSTACLYTATGGVGIAHIYYPNTRHQPPRAREGLMRFEPELSGWTPYGIGTVDDTGSQVVPDEGAYITDFGSAECDSKTRSHLPVVKRVSVPGLSR
jgi:hypothetical protein